MKTIEKPIEHETQFEATIEELGITQDEETNARIRLPIAEVKRDRRLQKRAQGTDRKTVNQYRDLLADGHSFPPPRVIYDGESFWLYGGFHRVSAALAAGLTELEFEVKNGTFADAEWLACGENTDHGLQASDTDKQEMVKTALKLHPEKSNRAIGAHCGVSKDMVADWRAIMNGETPRRAKSYTSPGGRTLEELVELYKPLGIFRSTGQKKFRYELERTSGQPGSNLFRGLDDAFNEFPNMTRLYGPKENNAPEAENRAASRVSGSVPFSYTPPPDSAASEAIVAAAEQPTGGSATRKRGAEELLERRIDPVNWSIWSVMKGAALVEELLAFHGFELLEDGDDDEEFGHTHTQHEYRGWRFRINHYFDYCFAIQFGDRWFSSELAEDDECPLDSEGYCRAVIDWIEWAAPTLGGQLNMFEQPISPRLDWHISIEEHAAWAGLPSSLDRRRAFLERLGLEILGEVKAEDFEEARQECDEYRGWNFIAEDSWINVIGADVWALIESQDSDPVAYAKEVIDWVEWALHCCEDPAPVQHATPIEVADPPARDPNKLLQSAASNKHYTPEPIWRAGLKCFGVEEFDLDPASFHGSPIPCKRIFTEEENGLIQVWEAETLWSNFPYSARDEDDKLISGYMESWVNRLIDSYDEGLVKRALTLTKSDCRTEWFHSLLDVSTAHCMIKGAVKHGRPEGPDGEAQKNNGSYFGSVVFYLGDELDQFYEAFAPLGRICQVIDSAFFGE